MTPGMMGEGVDEKLDRFDNKWVSTLKCDITVYGYFNCDDDGTLKRWLSCLPHRFSKFNQYVYDHDNLREK